MTIPALAALNSRRLSVGSKVGGQIHGIVVSDGLVVVMGAAMAVAAVAPPRPLWRFGAHATANGTEVSNR